jgi:hypothetical protein
MAGYEVDLNDRNRSSLEQDLRVSVPPVHYFPLLNSFHATLSWLGIQSCLAFFTPSFYEMILLLAKAFPITLRKSHSLLLATTHWIFAGGIPRLFTFFDAQAFWLLQRPRYSSGYPDHPWIAGTTNHFVDQFVQNLYQRYYDLYASQGIQALEQRVLKRKRQHMV